MRPTGRTSAGGSRRPPMPVPRPGRPAFGPAVDGRPCRAAPALGHTHPHRPASPRNRGTYRARMPGNSASNGMPCCVTKWWVKWSVDRAVSGPGYGPVKLSRAGDDRGVVSGEPAQALGPDSVANGTGDLRMHRRTADEKQLSPGAPILWAGEPPGNRVSPTAFSADNQLQIAVGRHSHRFVVAPVERDGRSPHGVADFFTRRSIPTDRACVTGSPGSTGERTGRRTRLRQIRRTACLVFQPRKVTPCRVG